MVQVSTIDDVEFLPLRASDSYSYGEMARPERFERPTLRFVV